VGEEGVGDGLGDGLMREWWWGGMREGWGGERGVCVCVCV